MAADHDFRNRAELFASSATRWSDLDREIIHARKLSTVDAHEMRVSEFLSGRGISKLKSSRLIPKIEANQDFRIRHLIQASEQCRLIKSEFGERFDDLGVRDWRRLRSK